MDSFMVLKRKKISHFRNKFSKKGLVQCPECKVGELMVIRSRTTRKRFMGCSNFMMDVRHLHHYYKKQE